MNREMFGGRFFVPSASLALFNILSIVCLIPVYDRVFVPLLHRFGRKLTLLQRIGARDWGREGLRVSHNGLLNSSPCFSLVDKLSISQRIGTQVDASQAHVSYSGVLACIGRGRDADDDS